MYRRYVSPIFPAFGDTYLRYMSPSITPRASSFRGR
jgi:hypothetical protein